MTVYVALLQGVNVGKHKRIAMTDLKRIVVEMGGEHATTVANSGNVVFAYEGELDFDWLRAKLEEVISNHVGMPVPTMVRTASELRSIVDHNPYPQVSDPKCLHVEFLPEDVHGALEGVDYGEDHLTAIGREIYLHAPNRISGITYDARTLHKRLGTHHTSRNWSTVCKLADIAAGLL